MSDMVCRTSILDGLDVTTLRARLTQMQLALLDLDSGAKVVSVAYAQGDGSRSVTYAQAERGALVQAILTVQNQIASLTGQPLGRRRPFTPFFTR